MNLFWLFVLAHLVADFPLQTDRIFEYKNKSSRGVLLHVLIVILTTIIVAFPYRKVPYFWMLLVFLGLIHFGLDKGKIEITKRYLQDNIFLFLLDQGLHLLTIWFLVFKIYDFSLIRIGQGTLFSFYSNNKLIVCLAGFVFAVFGGAPLIYYLRLLVHKLPGAEDKNVGFPDIRSRFPGYVERLVSTGGAFFGGWFFITVPLAFLPGFFWPRKGAKKDYINLLVGVALTLSIGIILREYVL